MTNRARVIALLVVLACAWPVAAVFASAADEHVRAAERYLDEGRVKAAIIEFKNALQKDPDHTEARFLLGSTYLQLGDGVSAEKELRRARRLGLPRTEWAIPLGKAYLLQRRGQEVLDEIRTEPSDTPRLAAELFALRGQAHVILGNPDEAARELARALELAPNMPVVLLANARLALQQQDWARAAGYVDKTLAVAPENVEAWVLKGETARRASKTQEAIAAYDRALELDRDHYGARLSRAAMRLNTGDVEAAQKDLDVLAPLAKNTPSFQYLTGLVAFQKRDLEAAANALEFVLRATPGHLQTHLVLGATYYAQQRLEAAEVHLSRYAAAVPDNAAAGKLLAAARLKRREPAGAIEVLTPLLEKNAEDPQLLAMLGTAYMQQRDYERGTQYLEQAAAVAPDVAAIRAQLALGHLAAGESGEAVTELETAVDLGQGLVQADILLVLAQFREGAYDKALAAAQALAKKLPDNPVPYNLMSAAYLRKGDAAAARAQLEKALKVAPQFTTAHINLARMDERDDKLDQARARYDTVLGYDPKNVRAMVALARLAERQGAQQKSLEWLERARSANPGALEPGLLLTRYYLATGDTLKGLDVARELAERNPKRPEALKALGSAQMAAGQAASAANSYEKLAELQPDSPEPHNLLGQVHVRQADFPAARKALTVALERQADYVPAQVGLAEVELAEKRFDAAAQIARSIQEKHLKSPVGYQLEGDVHRVAGDAPEAAEAYQEAYERQPSGQLALLIYQSHVLARQGDRGRAVLEDWIKRQPEDSAVRMALAADYERLGRAADAIREYEAVKSRQPNNLVVWNNLAWLYHQQDDPRALEYGARAHELAPQRFEVADTYGWILLHRGDPRKGLELVRDAASRAPHVPEIRYHLAVALHKNGQKDQARKELDRLLKSTQGFAAEAEARALLAELQKGG